ncbi:hypothetical protein Vi05172_g11780 [Venturia inaequalis]|nr:hypothetical protein Vi05172_g11780 [Venturia inaequalis]
MLRAGGRENRKLKRVMDLPATTKTAAEVVTAPSRTGINQSGLLLPMGDASDHYESPNL